MQLFIYHLTSIINKFVKINVPLYLCSYFFWSFKGKKPGEMTANEIDVVVALLQPCNVANTKCKYECSTLSLSLRLIKTETSIEEMSTAERGNYKFVLVKEMVLVEKNFKLLRSLILIA